MTGFPFLAQQLFNRPLAISADKAQIIVAALADRLGIARIRLPDGRLRAFDGDGGVMTIDDRSDDDDDGLGYGVISGIGIIEVRGTLVQRQLGLRPVSGMTGYNSIRQNFCMALEDETVRAIALDIDSPGGDVAGCFDLTDMIYLARGRKPIWALLDETAASAAYAIAAACDKVVVPRTGRAGSIGVIVLHVDLSKMLANEGIEVTVIQHGPRKSYGIETAPLSDPARRALQADVDAVGELFVSSIARYRGLSTARIRATEAAVYLGGAGRAVGLVDLVASPAEAFAMLVKMTAPTASGPRMPARQEMFGRRR
jgi:signal peptide peptidase SppA